MASNAALFSASVAAAGSGTGRRVSGFATEADVVSSGAAGIEWAVWPFTGKPRVALRRSGGDVGRGLLITPAGALNGLWGSDGMLADSGTIFGRALAQAPAGAMGIGTATALVASRVCSDSKVLLLLLFGGKGGGATSGDVDGKILLSIG